MRTDLYRIGIGLALVAVGGRCHSQQTYTYVTNFTKTNSIYSALNEQFPNSGIDTPNTSFIFNPATYSSPSAVPGANQTTNGVTFKLASDASGHDFTEVSYLPSSTLTIPVDVVNATDVHVLTNAYHVALANFTFTGTGGATETFTSVYLHDFNAQNPPNNYSSNYNGSVTPNFFDQTAFQVYDQGAGGTGVSTTGDTATYGINEDSFILSPAFSGQTLTSISIEATYNNPIILGVTVGSPAVASTPEPGNMALITAGMMSMTGIIARRRRVRAARA